MKHEWEEGGGFRRDLGRGRGGKKREIIVFDDWLLWWLFCLFQQAGGWKQSRPVTNQWSSLKMGGIPEPIKCWFISRRDEYEAVMLSDGKQMDETCLLRL